MVARLRSNPAEKPVTRPISATPRTTASKGFMRHKLAYRYASTAWRGRQDAELVSSWCIVELSSLRTEKAFRMVFPMKLRAAVIALAALAGVSISTAASADTGSIRFSVLKAGIVVGGSGGSG